MLWVRPGVLDANARRFCWVNVLMQVDLPGGLARVGTPDKCDFRYRQIRQMLQLWCRCQEARGVQPSCSDLGFAGVLRGDRWGLCGV